MRVLSATEAISPAIERTKLVLFSPFKMMRTWKIGCTAYLSVIGAVFLPWPLVYLIFLPRFGIIPSMPMGSALFIWAAVVVMSLIYLVVFYFVSKLRFAFFGMVLHRELMVTPMWRRYGAAADPWTFFKLGLGVVVGALGFLPAAHAFARFFQMLASMPKTVPGAPPSPELFSNIMAFYAMFVGLYIGFGLFYWVASLLSDFVVPSLVLEGVPLREAFRRVGQLVRNEPGQVAGYAFMKVILGIAGYMGAMIAFYIAVLIVLLVAVIVGGLIGLLLMLLHVPKIILIILAVVVGLSIYMFSLFYFMGVAYGTVMTFLESYLMYFLGGRYPLLGAALEASESAVQIPTVAAMPPPFGEPPQAF